MTFKMKGGSPFQRNFGVGNSPVKQVNPKYPTQESLEELERRMEKPKPSMESGGEGIIPEEIVKKEMEQLERGAPLLQTSPMKQGDELTIEERNALNEQEGLMKEDAMSDEEHEEYYGGTEYSRYTGDKARITRKDNPHYEEGVKDEVGRPMTEEEIAETEAFFGDEANWKFKK